jgi:hypothetical protein
MKVFIIFSIKKKNQFFGVCVQHLGKVHKAFIRFKKIVQ